ncbi:MAG: rod shape-determining protein RodA [Spirochaetes bacterium]|nr:MAG: rod shape-determining protein RodA [Spirochaetota bacterium]
MPSKNEIYNIDYVLVFAVIISVCIGILMIYSAGFDPIDKVNSGLFKKQIIWFLAGATLMMAFAFLSYRYLGDYSIYIYGLFLFLIVLTLAFGRPVRNTKAWLNFGLFSLQPSEFMKLGMVIILAKYLELRERDMHNLRELFIPSVLMAVPVMLILMQPDFGTAVVFVPVLFTMLFLGGADVSHLLSVVSIAVIATVVPMVITYREWIGAEGSNLLLEFFKDPRLIFAVSAILLVISIAAFALNFFLIKKYYRRVYVSSFVLSAGLLFSVVIQRFLKDYQKKRILVFLNPDLDPHGSGYNIIQSKIAIGSGGVVGKGFLAGSQSQLGFLPEKSSDFIFPVIAEEWGFVGALVIIGLLAVIVLRGIQIAMEAKDRFGSLLAAGIASIFFYHILINVGVVLGIMPVTGLPLCFVSYGGSNLLMSMMAVGILINIQTRKFSY